MRGIKLSEYSFFFLIYKFSEMCWYNYIVHWYVDLYHLLVLEGGHRYSKPMQIETIFSIKMNAISINLFLASAIKRTLKSLIII